MGAPERTQTRQQIQWLPLRRLHCQRPGVHPRGHSSPGRRHVNDPRRPRLAACGKTHAAFGRRCIPPEPLRFAPFFVAFRSKYTRYSSLTRLVGRAPHRPRRSREFHHRLLAPVRQHMVPRPDRKLRQRLPAPRTLRPRDPEEVTRKRRQPHAVVNPPQRARPPRLLHQLRGLRAGHQDHAALPGAGRRFGLHLDLRNAVRLVAWPAERVPRVRARERGGVDGDCGVLRSETDLP